MAVCTRWKRSDGKRASITNTAIRRSILLCSRVQRLVSLGGGVIGGVIRVDSTLL